MVAKLIIFCDISILGVFNSVGWGCLLRGRFSWGQSRAMPFMQLSQFCSTIRSGVP